MDALWDVVDVTYDGRVNSFQADHVRASDTNWEKLIDLPGLVIFEWKGEHKTYYTKFLIFIERK